MPASHQAFDLGAAVTTGVLLMIGRYHATLRFLAMRVVKALEHTADVCVSFPVVFLANAAEADLIVLPGESLAVAQSCAALFRPCWSPLLDDQPAGELVDYRPRLGLIHGWKYARR